MTKIDPKTLVKALAQLMNQVPSRERVQLVDPLNYFLGLVNLTLEDAPFLTKLRPLAAIEPSQVRRLTDASIIAHYVDVGTKEQPGCEGTFVTDLNTLQKACGLSLNSIRIYNYNRRDPRTNEVLLPFRMIPDGQLRWTPATEEVLAADKTKRAHLGDYITELLAPREKGKAPKRY